MTETLPTGATAEADSAGIGIWLITSAAFVSQELAAEFGQMPPAFLPIGTRRLFEYQVERIGAARPIYLTLPESFAVAEQDQQRLATLGVHVLALPEGLSLGEAVVFALNLIAGPDQPVWILHGDTLVDGMPRLNLGPDRYRAKRRRLLMG